MLASKPEGPAERAPARGRSTHPPWGRRKPSKVLLVEDDKSTADVIVDLLESNGYSVDLATNGTDARALVETGDPDLIILDLILPDVDGLTLCSEIRLSHDTPIVICSATSRQRDAVIGLRLGADDFVAKPFDITEFEARIRAVMRRAA